MSQNSLILPTSGTLSGLAAVQGINAAIDTLNTLSSGASAPSGAEPGQLWHDTANKLLKIRSMDNTTWISLGSLDETNYLFSASTKGLPSIYGLALSNDASSPSTVLDIAVGGTYDSTSSVYIRLATALTKNVTAAWVAGTGNGSLDTGTVMAGRFYHVFLIYNPSSGAVDILTSLSYTNPVLPSGYTNFAAIGAININGSTNIAPFVQNRDRFIYKTGLQDVGATGINTTPALITLSVPTGVKVIVHFRGTLVNTTGGNTGAILFQSPDEAYESSVINFATGSVNASLVAVAAQSGNYGYGGGEFAILTNTAAQINVTGNTTSGSTPIEYAIYTTGFTYPRGPQ